MLKIFEKELNSYLNSLVAYIVIIIFCTSMGLILWYFPETSVLEYGYADMSSYFSLAPYIFLFLIPAITMRSFAEEQKSGTLELLLTRPFKKYDIIIGKYLAALIIILLAILLSAVYYVSIYQLGNPTGNIDTAGTVGSYLGLISLAAVYTAVGVFCSSLTENQVIAFILAVFGCFLLYQGLDSFSSIDMWGKTSYLLEQLGLTFHYNYMSKGLIDIKSVLYFLSIVAIFMGLTKLKLDSRTW